jgi:hypothetical protein
MSSTPVTLTPVYFLAAVLLAGCASTPPNPQPQQTTQLKTRADDHSYKGALASPLHDVNLVRTKIPDVLLDAIDAPYAKPRPQTCPEIVAEVAPLDDALGPDLDRPATADNPSLLQRGNSTAADAVRGAVEGLIPYRGWVRRLTGAEQHDRLVAAAIAAGGVRRAYLKGLGLAMRCPQPGEPTGSAQTAVAGAQRLQRAADAAAAAR